ncbi:rCG31761, isoform CRA_a, partial [Rattus norvegicus]
MVSFAHALCAPCIESIKCWCTGLEQSCCQFRGA